MRAWLLVLAGPLVWAAHFSALYAIASLAALQMTPSLWQRQSAIVIVTLAALVMMAVALFFSRRRGADDLSDFQRTISRTGVALGAIGVVWQSLPALWL